MIYAAQVKSLWEIVQHAKVATLTARWRIDGIFSAKSWRAPFSRSGSPPRIRREKTSPCRKKNYADSDCLQFAARLPHRVNVRRGLFWRSDFKWFTQCGISHRAAPTSFAEAPWHTAQVLQSAADFRHEHTSRRAMRTKRLQRRGFSQASARLRPRLAFGLPQRA